MDIWQSVDSVLSSAADGSGNSSPLPSFSRHTSPNHPPPVSPRPSLPTSRPLKPYQQLGHLREQVQPVKPGARGPVSAEIISHKEAEMEQFVLGWTQEMLLRLGESAEDCPQTASALAESLSMSLAALSATLPADTVKDVVRHHILQLAGLA